MLISGRALSCVSKPQQVRVQTIRQARLRLLPEVGSEAVRVAGADVSSTRPIHPYLRCSGWV